ncbi:MAG TPA: acetylglutamate kinase [Gemmataceae bacterium]|nr:acetylglutamate kinase [Gemmataceae bacterium]
MDDAIRKAEALIEARNYIQMFRDKLTVIKLGGSAMEDAGALEATLQDVIFMETVGLRPILVHGGGKPIDRAMARSGLQPRKIQGRRYTDAATLDIVVNVLLHEINEGIVRRIRQLGGRAIGLHSGSLHSLFGERLRLPAANGQPIDLGFVGRVTRVESTLIESFCAGGVVPVIPSLAVDISATSETPVPTDGAEAWLNVNADTAAAAVAAQIRAEKLVFLTDTPGILLDRSRPDSLLASLNATRCRELIERRVIDEGMIPKVEACLESVGAGVRKTHVIDGRLPHSLLLEIYTDRGVGTEITLT